MNTFKKIILPMQGHNKSNLQWLYNIRSEDDSPLIFSYSKLKFWFEGTSYRSSEKLVLYVQIPSDILCDIELSDTLPCETYILHLLYPIIYELNISYLNTNKNVREKAHFEVQCAGNYIVRRSGIHYNKKEKAYVLRVNFNVPLVNAISVNAKAAFSAVRDILKCIELALNNFDRDELNHYIKTFAYQCEIRKYMSDHDLCSFIANGSILPRENGTTAPMKKAILFIAPKELESIIPLSDGTQIVGMGIKNGITVITGGGYSGKSTLLDAIEHGIYDHTPGDGREFVLTNNSALKIYAEDGRPISNLDLSPFFKYLPCSSDLQNFSTTHASGSVSQAANIIEAVCGKCRLLLIDEDKSATNFMIRDRTMRLVVKDEPIIPFTDRVQELYSERDVSTILVIGGSSEYLSYADTVILMEDYLPHIITNDIQKLVLPEITNNESSAHWTDSRQVVPKETSDPFLYFRNIDTKNAQKLTFDEYSAEIKFLTALISQDQRNTLSCIVEQLLTNKDIDCCELLEIVNKYIARTLTLTDTSSIISETAQFFYEEVRPIDVFCCVNRMRGLVFKACNNNI